MTIGFQTPQDAEDAFYDAFEAHDLEGMMAAWDESADVVCVQPMGPVLQGTAAVKASWQELFRHQQKPDVEIGHVQWFEREGLAVHVVQETVSVAGMPAGLPPLVATNVYRLAEGGWRMVCHHVSPPPPPLRGGG